MKKWNKKALALLGLGAATLVGGTFAYYNQTVSLDNPLGTGKYENELVEDYTPPTEDVKPGATIAKKVGAKNTGDYPVMVRIRMDEKWTRVVLDADGKPTNQTTPVESLSQTNGSNNLPIFNIADTAYNEGNDQQKLWQATQPGDETESNGLTANDNTVVRKNLGDSTKWIYNAADGYWYYYKILGKGETTDSNLLESISIASNIDLGHYTQKDYYYVGTGEKEAVPDNAWTEYKVTRTKGTDGKTWVTDIELYNDDKTSTTSVGDKNGDGEVNAIDLAIALNVPADKKLFRKNESILDENAKGYADANYTLMVTSQFVQATPDALKTAWTKDAEGNTVALPAEIQAVIDSINADTVGATGNSDSTTP